MTNRTRKGPGKTKPICRPGQRWARAGEAVALARCAKQTQFAADGQGRPSPGPGALTMPPARGQVRQTNPIWLGDKYGREPTRRSAQPPLGPIGSNTPNCEGRAGGRAYPDSLGARHMVPTTRAAAKPRKCLPGKRQSGRSIKAEGVGDGLAHGKSAIAKLRGLRLTLPPVAEDMDVPTARSP
jgi:hypothetical protein